MSIDAISKTRCGSRGRIGSERRDCDAAQEDFATILDRRRAESQRDRRAGEGTAGNGVPVTPHLLLNISGATPPVAIGATLKTAADVPFASLVSGAEVTSSGADATMRLEFCDGMRVDVSLVSGRVETAFRAADALQAQLVSRALPDLAERFARRGLEAHLPAVTVADRDGGGARHGRDTRREQEEADRKSDRVRQRRRKKLPSHR